MVQKHRVNGIEFQKVSPVEIEKIEEGCRQYRSDYIFDSMKSVVVSLFNQAQKLLGGRKKCQAS